MHRQFFVFSVLVTLASASLLLPEPALAQSRSVLDGVYTEEQAIRGEMEYLDLCERCHTYMEEEDSAPFLNGRRFMDRWREDRLTNLFTYMRDRMPKDAPGSLSESRYLDLTAFLLYENGFGWREEALTVDDLDDIQVVGLDGPQPLPNLALIAVVGCVENVEDGVWRLSQVGAPSRILSALTPSTPEEIAAAETKPLGTGAYVLQNLTGAGDHEGMKVQIKGVLIKQFDGEYLNVLALDPLGVSCS